MTAISSSRRAFLDVCAGLAAALALSVCSSAAIRRTRVDGLLTPPDPPPDLLGSWQRDGTYYAGLWTARRGIREVALPYRGHALLVDPGNPAQAIVVARRPGGYLMRFDVLRGRLAGIVEADLDRVFNGHAAFSPRGDRLYTTENDIYDGSGIIGVRDAGTLVKQKEFPTYGLGPHALLVEPDATLLVANGGILTLPEMGRAKLDLERMDPSLVRLDARDGRLLGQWRLTDPLLSIRHLAQAATGVVGVALQAEHGRAEAREAAPLLALFDGSSLHPADTPQDLTLGGYGGDVACVSAMGATHFAVGCTRAGLVGWWDSVGRWIGGVPLKSACAMTCFGDAIIAATEEGQVARITTRAAGFLEDQSSPLKWDNHILAYP